MAGLGGLPDSVPRICTYRAYLSSLETDPFYGGYKVVLEPYMIDPMNAATAQTPASVYQKNHITSQQGDPNVFLLWHAMPGLAKDQNPSRILLLHSVSYYASWMGRP